MISKLSFKEYEFVVTDTVEGEIPFNHVEILIDNVPLKKHLKMYELSIAMGKIEKDLAGNYEAIGTQQQFKKLLFKSSSYFNATKVFPYQCAYDLTGDWLIGFDVKIRFPYVYFDNFKLEISHINKHEVFEHSLNSKEKKYNHKIVNWNYNNFQKFQFNYFQYFSAVKDLGASKDWLPI